MILSIGFPQLIDTGELAPANHLKLFKHKHFIYTRKKDDSPSTSNDCSSR